jgi:thioredoxin 1
MLERLLIVVLLAAVGVLVYHWQTRRQLQRVSSDNSRTKNPLLADLRPGIPAIVYFTTPGCLPCRTRQQPALHTLHNRLGDAIQVITVDATEQPDLADTWGVMSAPTTFVLDETGNATAVNHGVADADKLQQQLGIQSAAVSKIA